MPPPCGCWGPIPASAQNESEVIGLSEIDFRKIGTGMKEPVTRSLQQVFQDAVHGRSAQYLGRPSLVYEDQPAFKRLDIPGLGG